MTTGRCDCPSTIAMNRLTLLALAALAALGAAAQSVDYITFRQTDGTEQSLPAIGTKIVFTNGRLVATNGTATASADLTALDKMFFSAKPTGITTTTSGTAVRVTITGGHLNVSAPAGAVVTLHNADGRQLDTAARLSAGLYIVRVNGQSYKVKSE